MSNKYKIIKFRIIITYQEKKIKWIHVFFAYNYGDNEGKGDVVVEYAQVLSNKIIYKKNIIYWIP